MVIDASAASAPSLVFLLLYGQAGPGGDYRDRALAQRLVTTHPDGRTGTLCGVRRLTGC